MDRKAILIESSSLDGNPDLPGARVDITNWQTYLMSDEGGAWNEAEITVLRKPTWAALKSALSMQRTTDYVFITFSGHGYHIEGHDLDESRICLNDKEDIPVSSINPGNPRCSFVIDACRQLIRDRIPLKEDVMRGMIRSAALRDRAAYRKLFDEAVAQAEKGIIRLFSCDIEEAAGESRTTGGFYTSSLLSCCSDWYSDEESGKRYYYSLWRAHSHAVTLISKRLPQQHPKYDGGRRNHHFPIAVKP